MTMIKKSGVRLVVELPTFDIRVRWQSLQTNFRSKFSFDISNPT
jgi:hypothetical protein